MKIKVIKAEFWESRGLIPTAIAFVQALAGKEVEMGNNEKLRLNS